MVDNKITFISFRGGAIALLDVDPLICVYCYPETATVKLRQWLQICLCILKFEKLFICHL